MAATNHSVGIAHVTVIPTNAAAVAAEETKDDDGAEAVDTAKDADGEDGDAVDEA
jgi:hypothetical protein